MKKHLLFICSLFFSLSLVSQVSIISQTNVSCPGMCNGAITLSITGGTMPYSVTNLGSLTCTFPPYPPVFSNTITISGLCACAYSIQVKDGTNALIGTAPATITAPPPIVISFSVQNVCCFGQCNGSVFPFVSGGTAPYNYIWSPNNPTTGACAGTYDLCVTDLVGCVKCSTVQVTQPPVFSLTSSITAATCGTCCNGQVNAFASGGNPGYTYTIYPGATTNTTGAFTNLCAGTYSVCSNDAGCCSACIAVTVPSGPTGITNLHSQIISIDVYPNPSAGNIKLISSQNLSGMNYEVFDIIGNKIDSGKASEPINISSANDGVYILVIRKSDGALVARRKLNITH